ncbi:MAG: hypothetical protein N3B16_08930, partial [Candidatus Aminicenantes bacterium]|nr:hypothetical protein [Candidatus Aminicenantes bacterium]
MKYLKRLDIAYLSFGGFVFLIGIMCFNLFSEAGKAIPKAPAKKDEPPDRPLIATELFIETLANQIKPKRTELPFMNPGLSPEVRAEDVVKRLTLEEKISQLMNEAPAIPRLGIPQYNW